jgi:hypothetical protein
MSFEDWAERQRGSGALRVQCGYEMRAARAAWEAATEAAAKECDDRAAAPQTVASPAYKAGARDCAIFIRGSLNRTYSSTQQVPPQGVPKDE